jgi:hypothetical protein
MFRKWIKHDEMDKYGRMHCFIPYTPLYLLGIYVDDSYFY